MTDKLKTSPAGGGKDVRAERLKSALRDNLKRRKAQARGRAGMTIVTPDDDAAARDDAAGDNSTPPGDSD